MVRLSERFFLGFASLFLVFASLFIAAIGVITMAARPALAATKWMDPTADELKMSSDPAAPDAAAVYLYREEKVDEKLHYHSLYARVKILTEKGKEEYGDIEIPYQAGISNIVAVEGRTIHADGTVVPFTGKPYDKELVKRGDVKVMAKVFSMPDVQVGSILEYRYELQYADQWMMAPDWQIEQPIYVHKAHYHYTPPDSFVFQRIMVRDALGKTNPATRLVYFPELPPGAKVERRIDGSYDLVVNDVPPLPDEEFEPPLNSFAYRLRFYYLPQVNGNDFWKYESKVWSKDVDRFAEPNDKIRAAVAQIVAPGDTDDQKLRKIDAAVMKLENTRFTREHTSAEEKAEGLRVKTAADIWEQKRGTDDEITRLFISMARAAGMKAYAMIVTERNRNLLNPTYLEWGQFEDEIAIVQVGGKDVFFDPGQRYCEYGKLHWMHTEIEGIRQSDQGDGLSLTPGPSFRDNGEVRMAFLTIDPDGTLKGTVRITMKGVEALRWRQRALESDEQTAKREFESELQDVVPDGVQVKMNHFVALTDPTSELMAVLDVSGSMGTQTGKRIFLPSAFFETRARPLFAAQKREAPIDLHYAHLDEDQVQLTLGPGLTIESVPAKADIPLEKVAEYKARYGSAGSTYNYGRLMAVGASVFKKEEYPQLREFFQKAGAQDQQQVVLERTVVAASAGAAQ